VATEDEGMSWFRRSVSRRRIYGDISNEIRAHLDEKVEELVAGGMPREEAEHAARREFGNVMLTEQRGREVWRWPRLENFLLDVRYGARVLRKTPGFTAVAILTLALGIGASTGIFSVVNAVLLRGLPFAQADRLAALFQTPPNFAGIMGWAADGPDVVAWQRDNHSFAAIAASLQDAVNLTGSGAPRFVRGQQVTANYFDLLGAQASLGRTFARGEDETGRDHEVILSYGLWKSAFTGQDVLGRTVYLDDRSFTVIGVMPATFHDPRTWMNPESEYWIPLDRTQLESNRGEHMYAAFGRLAPNVSFAQAQEEMSAIGRREAQEYPKTNEGFGVRVSPLDQVSLETYEGGRFQSIGPAILLLQFAAGFLFLLACANVANLALSKWVGRQRELALRSALGAGGLRLAQQMITEGVLLSVIGGAAGILLAAWCESALIALAPRGYLPPTARISLDWEVVGFALGVAVLGGILFGLFPAIRAARQNLSDDLKGAGTGTAGGGSMPRARRALVIFEVASTLVLLVGGGLMTRSLASLLAINPGFEPRNFFTAGLSPSGTRYARPEQIVQFYAAAQERVAAIPGVEAVGFTSAPDFGINDESDVVIEGAAASASLSGGVPPQICMITPGYFRAAGIPLLAGRDFSSAEILTDRKVAIVTEAFAKHFWPHRSVIGKHLKWGNDQTWREVVGLVGDVRNEGLAAAPLPEVYLPLNRDTAIFGSNMNVVARSSTTPAVLAREVERQVWKLDPGVPLSHVRAGSQILGDWTGYLRYRTVLLASFAVMALLIAVVGLFGAMAYTTAQRTHEIGIRLALGAQRTEVLRLVMKQGTELILIGLGVGAAGALAVTRLLRSLLFGVSPTDARTFIGACAVLAIVALAACYVPARRATRVDPVTALRNE
jgi:predicted permease